MILFLLLFALFLTTVLVPYHEYIPSFPEILHELFILEPKKASTFLCGRLTSEPESYHIFYYSSLRGRNFVGECFWKILFYALWTFGMCSNWTILKFHEKSKNTQNSTNPNPTLEDLCRQNMYWVPGSTVLNFDIGNRNFVGKFFVKNLFYATWTLRTCSCRHILKFYEKSKKSKNITDLALGIWCVRYRYWVPGSTILNFEINSRNFVRKFF